MSLRRDLNGIEVAGLVIKAIVYLVSSKFQLPPSWPSSTERRRVSTRLRCWFVEFNRALSEGRLHSLEGGRQQHDPDRVRRVRR